MEFEVYKGKNDEHYFRGLIKGEKILRSEGYTSKSSAENGIESVKNNLLRGEEGIDKKQTKNGKEYFNVVSKNGQVVATSKYFNTEEDRDELLNKIT